jgi:hypothetical protein
MYNFPIFEEFFLFEYDPGERMREKDRRYWHGRPRHERDEAIMNFLEKMESERDRIFNFYTTDGIHMCEIIKLTDTHLEYKDFKYPKDVYDEYQSIERSLSEGKTNDYFEILFQDLKFKEEDFYKKKKIQISRIGGAGALYQKYADDYLEQLNVLRDALDLYEKDVEKFVIDRTWRYKFEDYIKKWEDARRHSVYYR